MEPTLNNIFFPPLLSLCLTTQNLRETKQIRAHRPTHTHTKNRSDSMYVQCVSDFMFFAVHGMAICRCFPGPGAISRECTFLHLAFQILPGAISSPSAGSTYCFPATQVGDSSLRDAGTRAPSRRLACTEPHHIALGCVEAVDVVPRQR